MSIVKKELAAHIEGNIGYLAAKNFVVTTSKGEVLFELYRQAGGAGAE